MKIEKFHLCCNTSLCAGAYKLLRGRAPAHLRVNIAHPFAHMFRMQKVTILMISLTL
jgi:hypothetical protein